MWSIWYRKLWVWTDNSAEAGGARRKHLRASVAHIRGRCHEFPTLTNTVCHTKQKSKYLKVSRGYEHYARSKGCSLANKSVYLFVHQGERCFVTLREDIL